RTLEGALGLRWLVVLVGIGVAASSYWLFAHMKSELSPTEDRGTVVGIISAPEGSTITYTDAYARRLEPLYKLPEVARYFTVSGFPTVANGISFLCLKPWSERRRSQQQIVAELGPKMYLTAPGVLAFPINPASLGQSPRNTPIEYVILTSQPYSELQKMVEAVLTEARKNPGLLNLDT